MNYEEMQTETVDSAAEADVTTEDMLSAFDEGWDDDGPPTYEEAEPDSEEVNSDEAEANQQEAESADASEATEETEQTEGTKTEETDQFLPVKYLGEELKVSREEAIPYIQKGMDYDRKVTKLNNKIAEYEDFLNELAIPGNMTIEQLIDSTRARMLQNTARQNGKTLTDTEALFQAQKARVDKANAEARPETKKEAAPSPDAVQKFVDAYPNVKAEDIPQAVWQEVKETGDLLGAYIKHENAELKKRLSAIETNQKNEKRSTGSRKSAWASKARDPFDEGWDSV